MKIYSLKKNPFLLGDKWIDPIQNNGKWCILYRYTHQRSQGTVLQISIFSQRILKVVRNIIFTYYIYLFLMLSSKPYL